MGKRDGRTVRDESLFGIGSSTFHDLSRLGRPILDFELLSKSKHLSVTISPSVSSIFSQFNILMHTFFP